MTIYIEGLTFETILGILPQERTRPQRVVIDLKMTYHYKEGTYIDYAEVCRLIEEKMHENAYRLVEEALEDLTRRLIRRYPNISSLTLKICKPDILPHAVPCVEKTLSNP